MNTILLFLLSLVGHFTARFHQPGHVKPGDAPFLQEENPSEFIEETTDQRRLRVPGITVWKEGVNSIKSITSVFTLSSSTTNDQTLPTSLMLPDNNVAVVWFSNHLQFSGGPNIVMMMRIFNSRGVPVTNEIPVTYQRQLVPLASMALMQDGFLVTWIASATIRTIDFECYWQLFYFNGTKKGSIEIIDSLGNNDFSVFVRVAANQDHSEFLFAWTSYLLNSASIAANVSDVRMQRFSTNPFQEKGNSQVANNHLPDNQLVPLPFYFTNGSSMVLWLDERNQPAVHKYDIYAHFFDQNGMSQLVSDYKINDEKVDGTVGERVADLGDDKALVFWLGSSQTTSRSSIFYRIVVSGAPLLTPTIYEVDPTVDYHKYSPGVSIALDQFVLIYWSSVRAGGPATYNITAQLFLKNMTPFSSVFVLKSELGKDGHPYIAPKSDSGLLFLTWEQEEVHNSVFSNGVVGQLFQLIVGPTLAPTKSPTHNPTIEPTIFPTLPPTLRPTNSPTTALSSWWKKSQGAVIGISSGVVCCGAMILTYLCIRRLDNINARRGRMSRLYEEQL